EPRLARDPLAAAEHPRGAHREGPDRPLREGGRRPRHGHLACYLLIPPRHLRSQLFFESPEFRTCLLAFLTASPSTARFTMALGTLVCLSGLTSNQVCPRPVNGPTTGVAASSQCLYRTRKMLVI